MDVSCTRCGTEYEFDDALISERGTNVRCTQCGYQFKVFPTKLATVGPDEWIVLTGLGRRIVYRSLRELQNGIVKGDVAREDLLARGSKPPRPLGSIAELDPLFVVKSAPERQPSTLTGVAPPKLSGTPSIPVRDEVPNFDTAGEPHTRSGVAPPPNIPAPNQESRPSSQAASLPLAGRSGTVLGLGGIGFHAKKPTTTGLDQNTSEPPQTRPFAVGSDAHPQPPLPPRVSEETAPLVEIHGIHAKPPPPVRAKTAEGVTATLGTTATTATTVGAAATPPAAPTEPSDAAASAQATAGSIDVHAVAGRPETPLARVHLQQKLVPVDAGESVVNKPLGEHTVKRPSTKTSVAPKSEPDASSTRLVDLPDQFAAKVAHQKSSDAESQAAPEVATQGAPEIALEEATKSELRAAPEEATRGVPEIAPDAASNAAPDAAPDRAPKAVPDVAPQASPEVAPKSAENEPELPPEVARKAVPEVAPKAVAPKAVPDTAPEIESEPQSTALRKGTGTSSKEIDQRPLRKDRPKAKGQPRADHDAPRSKIVAAQPSTVQSKTEPRGIPFGRIAITIGVLVLSGYVGMRLVGAHLQSQKARVPQGSATQSRSASNTWLPAVEAALERGDDQTANTLLSSVAPEERAVPVYRSLHARVTAESCDKIWWRLQLVGKDSGDAYAQSKQQLTECLERLNRAVAEARTGNETSEVVLAASLDARRMQGEKSETADPRALEQLRHPSSKVLRYSSSVMAWVKAGVPDETVVSSLREIRGATVDLGSRSVALLVALVQLGRFSEARQELKLLQAQSPSHPLQSELTSYLDRAERAQTDAAADAGVDAPAAASSVDVGKPAEPADAGDPDSDLYAGDFRLRLTRANECLSRNELTRAQKLLRSVLAQRPNDTEAITAVGDVHRRRGDLAQARQMYDKALGINGNYLPAMSGAAEVRWKSGDRAGALPWYKRILERVGDTPGYGQTAAARIREFEGAAKEQP